MVIFFKVQERVKKVNFSGSSILLAFPAPLTRPGASLDDLNDLFLERFTDLARHDLRPFYITDRETRLQVFSC